MTFWKKTMPALLFGTAGIPLSSKGLGTVEGIREVRRLGLGAMELEFVQSVNIRPEKAPGVRAAAQEEGVLLTCHAPYYINLNAQEEEKRRASADRILNSARVAAACGGWSVCFHGGYYMGMPHPIVFEKVKEALEDVTETLRVEGTEIWIRPEIGGKTTSWGSLEEILEMSKQLPGILPCIDWAHLHARSLGRNNTEAEFRAVLESMENALGREAIQNLHCHVEGIEIGKTGEKMHKNLEDSGLNYRVLVAVLKDFGGKGVVICESPNIEKDALLLQRAYQSL